MDTTIENNFRNFFENNIDFLFILDMKGNVIEMNSAVKEILGYQESELIGESVLLVHPPEFRDEASKIVHQMLNKEVDSCPIPLLTKSNNYIPVETRVFPGTWNSQPALIGVSRNLTDLKLSEEKFSQVFNLSPILKAISSVDTGIFIDVNRQFLNTLGYSREELIGKNSKDLHLFADFNERVKALKLFETQGYLENFETQILSKTGEVFDCLFSIEKIKIQTHEYLLTSANNITKLKNAENKIKYFFNQQKLLSDISQLINQSSKLDLILDHILKLLGEHTGVSRVYIFEDFNNGESTCNTFEWCNSGIVPQKDYLMEVSYDIIPSWKKLLINDGYIFSKNIENLPEDIHEILKPQEIKSILVYPLFVENAFYGFIGFDECNQNKEWEAEEINLLRTVANLISNAFEKRFVLARLEESELRLKLALKSAKEGLWDWKNETGYVYFDETWCKMIGYEQNEIVPNVSSWEKLVHPDDMPEVTKTLENHINGESEFYETTHRVKTKDGSWKWILDHGQVVYRDEKNRPLRTIGTHIDVTNQKNTEQQLKELIDTKDKLFSIIAHDLRGPIAYLLQVLDYMTTTNEIDEKSKNEFLENMKKTSKTTLTLLENLLNWSRSQLGNIEFDKSVFSVNKLIEDNVQLYSSSAKIKGISVATNLNKNYFALADSNSINLVFRNLLSNSIKFTPKNGKIDISVTDEGEKVKVEISDTGVGMEKDIVENLFNSKSFYSTRGTEDEKGTGLGLMLCKDFIEKNGGTIFAESILNVGSKFIFTIPSVV